MLCQECNIRPINGNVTTMMGEIRQTCSFCYKYVLYMRPLGYKINIKDLIKDRREALKLCVNEDEQRKIKGVYLDLYYEFVK